MKSLSKCQIHKHIYERLTHTYICTHFNAHTHTHTHAYIYIYIYIYIHISILYCVDCHILRIRRTALSNRSHNQIIVVFLSHYKEVLDISRNRPFIQHPTYLHRNALLLSVSWFAAEITRASVLRSGHYVRYSALSQGRAGQHCSGLGTGFEWDLRVGYCMCFYFFMRMAFFTGGFMYCIARQ